MSTFHPTPSSIGFCVRLGWKVRELGFRRDFFVDADHKIISVGACLNPACNRGYEGTLLTFILYWYSV